MPNTTTNNNNRPNIKLATYQTRDKWLHIREAFEIGKLVFHAGYRANGKATAQTVIYLDIPKARVIFEEIVRKDGHITTNEKDYSFFGGSTRDGKTESRRMQVKWDPKKDKTPLGFHFKVGPGKPGKNGAVMPDTSAPADATTAVSISMDTMSARAMALEILAQINAYDVNNFPYMMQERYQEARDSRPASPTSPANGEPANNHRTYTPPPRDLDDDSDIFLPPPTPKQAPAAPSLPLIDEGTRGTLENLLLQTYQEDGAYEQALADIFASVKAGRGAEIADTGQLTQVEALALIAALEGPPHAPNTATPEADEEYMDSPF